LIRQAAVRAPDRTALQQKFLHQRSAALRDIGMSGDAGLTSNPQWADRIANLKSEGSPPLSTDLMTRQSVTLGLDLDGIDAVLGIHIGAANSLFLSRLERQLEPFKVTPKQVAILWLVNANPGVKQSDLSRFFKIERPTVHQFVRQLTLNGHLISEPSKLDRRAGGLWITETGTMTLAAAREIIFTDESELLAPLASEERSELYRLVMKLYLSAPQRN
jgi:MarR family transcriptional regulator, organic hydroperoxide resistance regulator